MFGKRIVALAAAIVLSLSVCMTSFAAMDLDEYDSTMYDTVKQLIEEEVDQDIKDTELEILEAIHAEITSQGSSRASQKEGTKLIKTVASEKNLWASLCIAAFQKAPDQCYGDLHGIRGVFVYRIWIRGYYTAGNGKECVRGGALAGVFKNVRRPVYYL